METLRILEPGPLCTVQDLGRYGFMGFGVPISGALDHFSARIANLLVGNREDMALLEATYSGPSFEVLEEALISIAGAWSEVDINGERFSPWSSFLVKRGDIIRIRPYRSGLRAYLAVAGGIKVPPVMGSRSTCLKGGFGGLEGRPLRKGDIIETEAPTGHLSPKQLDPKYIPRYGPTLRLRVVLGPQDNHFFTERFLCAPFEISPRSDRMGIRLEGGKIPLREGFSSSIISEPVIPGAIQVTPDGSPLIILGEQTMGGYAKIATVIYPDLPLLSQARPGDKVSFLSVGLEEAQSLYFEYFEDLEALKRSLI